jgi:hypothetical protein
MIKGSNPATGTRRERERERKWQKEDKEVD